MVTYNTGTKRDININKLFYLFCLCFPHKAKDFESVSMFKNYLQFKNFMIISIYEDTKLIGFILSLPLVKKRNLYIEWCGMHPNYRRHGYMSKALSYLREIVKSFNIETITLITRENNIPMRLWASTNHFLFNNRISNADGLHYVKYIQT